MANFAQLPEEVVEETESRYRERQKLRRERSNKLASRDWLAADSQERVEKRLKRLGRTAAVRDAAFLERMFGENDLVDISFLELGLWVARSVGRIVSRTAVGGTRAIGTGFMVSPRLLLTNAHVFFNPKEASNSLVEFNYQKRPNGQLLTSVGFAFEPETLFIADRELDYSLVAVSQKALDGSALQSFGWNRLIEEEGKIIVGEYLNVIQHPDGEPKKLALRQNRLVDVLNNFLHYEADTEGGSSGSPVFNDQWEVVALHHSGAARRDEQGRILTKEGTRWSRDMGEQRVAWIGNEGVRISRIISNLKQHELTTNDQLQLRDEMFEARPPLPMAVPSGP